LNHISTIRSFIFKNGYLLILAGWLLTFSYLFQYYWSYSSAPVQVKKALQKAINKRETDFTTILADTSLLLDLKKGRVEKTELLKLLEKDYFIFVASDGADGFQTRFWNTQTILPNIELWQRANGIWFEQLINGYYTVYKKSVKLGDGSFCSVMALIPVKWNYFVTTSYLSNSFTYLKGIEKYYTLSDVQQTALQVKSTDGTGLFWLKEQNSFPQPLNNITIILRLLAVFCLLMFLHKTAAAIAGRYTFFIGLLFLVAAILFIRILSYYFPVPLNLRQFELFDPAVYGSNRILRSLGDLFINSFLLLWILLFIRRYGKSAVLLPLKMNDPFGLVITAVLMFALTILFGNIIRSMVADSQISFNVTNFFSLTVFSFAGFSILGSLALNYFLLIDWLFDFLKRYSKGKLQIQVLAVTITGLIYLSLTINSAAVIYHLFLLGWLLLLLVLLNREYLQLRFLPSNGRVIFWLFFFSVSLTLLLITENSRKEWQDRTRMAEKLSLQTDPSAENLLSIALQNFRTEFLDNEFYRFTTSGGNQFLKDSLISENFSGYLNKFETEIYTFTAGEEPLFNVDSISFNTLNTIYKLQSKPTSVRDWQYYEESFDRFYYIARKNVTDRETNQQIGYVFIISRPKRYADEKFYPELFSKTFNLLPDNTPSYAYAIYKNKELISSVNDYPFPIHLNNAKAERTTIESKERNGYSELWYTVSKNLTVVVVKSQNKLLEGITLFAYLFCVFLLMLAVFRFVQYILQLGIKPAHWKAHLQLTFRTQVHTTIIGISIFSFLIIGASTIFFFINRHSGINKERLSRIISIMRAEVEAALSAHAVFDDVLKVTMQHRLICRQK
jgi:two-component system nitrogen regulation sensor histidine kinase NtrY